MVVHARLNIEFTEGDKCHKLMNQLKCLFLSIFSIIKQHQTQDKTTFETLSGRSSESKQNQNAFEKKKEIVGKETETLDWNGLYKITGVAKPV